MQRRGRIRDADRRILIFRPLDLRFPISTVATGTQPASPRPGSSSHPWQFMAAGLCSETRDIGEGNSVILFPPPQIYLFLQDGREGERRVEGEKERG